jgi:hypothetical protein
LLPAGIVKIDILEAGCSEKQIFRKSAFGCLRRKIKVPLQAFVLTQLVETSVAESFS